VQCFCKTLDLSVLSFSPFSSCIYSDVGIIAVKVKECNGGHRIEYHKRRNLSVVRSTGGCKASINMSGNGSRSQDARRRDESHSPELLLLSL